jgi:hypothetical protein
VFWQHVPVSHPVIPAKAGMTGCDWRTLWETGSLITSIIFIWIPAFAGMTNVS